jgi:hypothetical protein
MADGHSIRAGERDGLYHPHRVEVSPVELLIPTPQQDIGLFEGSEAVLRSMLRLQAAPMKEDKVGIGLQGTEW